MGRLSSSPEPSDRTMGQLVLAALFVTFFCLSGIFGGWFCAFVMMRFAGHSLLVGMNYLVWPIIFPLYAALPIFGFFLFFIPRFPGPYMHVFDDRTLFYWTVFPITLLALLIMLATCPLDIGGTFLTKGWNAFGRG